MKIIGVKIVPIIISIIKIILVNYFFAFISFWHFSCIFFTAYYFQVMYKCHILSELKITNETKRTLEQEKISLNAKTEHLVSNMQVSWVMKTF